MAAGQLLSGNGTTYHTGVDYSKKLSDAINAGSKNTAAIKGDLDSYLAKTKNSDYSKYYNQGMVDNVNAYLSSLEPVNTGGSSNTDYVSQYMDIIAQQRAAEEAAARRQIENSVAANEAYIPQVNQAYADQQKQNYISRELAKSALPENMAALGLTGGASESALLGVNTNYENSRSTADSERNRAIQQIMQNSANIRATGDVTLARLGKDYLSQQISIMQQAQQRADQMAMWQAEFGASENQRAIENSQWGTTNASTAAQQALENAYRDSQTAFENDLATKYYNLDAQKAARQATSSYSSSAGTGKSTTTEDTSASPSSIDYNRQKLLVEVKADVGLNSRDSARQKLNDAVSKGIISSAEALALAKQYGL